MSATILETCCSARTADPDKSLFLELLDELTVWRLATREVACHRTEDPRALPPGDPQRRLAARIEALKKRIEEALDQFNPAALSQGPVVGALRALPEAGVTYAGLASGVDWRPWKEARF